MYLVRDEPYILGDIQAQNHVQESRININFLGLGYLMGYFRDI